MRTGTVRIRLTQLDGKLPNLALMKLAHWHKAQGDEVVFSRAPMRDMYEGEYDRVYGSIIFAWSTGALKIFKRDFPDAIVGGSGIEDYNAPKESWLTVERYLGLPVRDYEFYDYCAARPDFTGSIGYTQRGCRLACEFCPVPKKEGANRHVNAIAKIWRGEGYPKHLHLLDNDFFGQKEWPQLIDAIAAGGFKVCWNQGINVRFITDEAATALASVKYYDDSFTARRVYTAWDRLGDEKVFFKGLQRLYDAGVKRDQVLAYMLVGYDWRGKNGEYLHGYPETWEDVFHRFKAMVDAGVRPYPMVFNNANAALKKFQRWAIKRYYHKISFAKYLTIKDPRVSEELNAWSKSVALIPSDELPPMKLEMPSGPVNAPNKEQLMYEAAMKGDAA